MRKRNLGIIATIVATACIASAVVVGVYEATSLSEVPNNVGVTDAVRGADVSETAMLPAAHESVSETPGALHSQNQAADVAEDTNLDDPYIRLQQTIDAQQGAPDFDGFIVKLNQPVAAEVESSLAKAVQAGAQLHAIPHAPASYTAATLSDVKAAISADAIEYIEPDFKVSMLEGKALSTYASEEASVYPASTLIPNDHYYATHQYNISDLNVPPVWEYGLEGQDFDDSIDMDHNGAADDDDIVVAVIDSGLKDGHEDIDWDRVITGVSFADGTDSSDTNDTDGHGTFVTGIIASIKDNEVGTAGILQRAKVMPLRVFNGESASDSIIVAAINYAAEQRELFDSTNGQQGTNISVVNMSLGSAGTSSSMNTACQRCISDGIIVVCAAGNDGDTTASYPAQYSMGVGSTDNTKTVSSYSQRLSTRNGSTYANKVWVTAPGEAVTSLYCENTKSYAQMSGTSFSSPEVAALAALCKGLDNDIDQASFMQLLKDTAIPKTGSMGTIEDQDVEYGWGLVDFKRTADALIQSQFGSQEGQSIVTARVQNEAGSPIQGAFVDIYELGFAEDGTEQKGVLIEPANDGTWTLQKGHRYFYSAHAEKYDYQEGTFATLSDVRTLTITLLGKAYPVTFDLENTSGKQVVAASIVVRSAGGKTFEANSDGIFMLRNGLYSYTIEADAYFDTTGNFTIDDAQKELESGTVVPVTLRGNQDVCSLSLRVTGAKEDAEKEGSNKGYIVRGLTVVLTDSNGDQIDPYKDGAYKLDAGVYAYTIYHDEYRSASGKIAIAATEIGTSRVVTVPLTGKLYTVMLHLFPLGSNPDVLIYDSYGEVYQRQLTARKLDYRTYRVTDGTYYFAIHDDNCGTYTGTFRMSNGTLSTRGLSINLPGSSLAIMQKVGEREFRVNLQKDSPNTLFTDGSAPPSLADIDATVQRPEDAHVHSYVSKILTEATCSKEGEIFWECVDGDDSFTEQIPKTPHMFIDGVCTVCATLESDTIQDNDWLTLNWNDGTTTSTRKIALSQLTPYQQVANLTMRTSYTSYAYTVYGIPLRTLLTKFGGEDRCIDSLVITAMDVPENKDSYGNLYTTDIAGDTLDKAYIVWYTINNSTGEARTGSEENNMRVAIDGGYWMYGPDVLDISFGNHAYDTSQTVAPTCTEEGYTELVCSKCATRYRADIKEPTGHTFDVSKDKVTPATCTAKGFTTHTCEVCGEMVIDSYVPALGHAWDAGVITKAPTAKTPGIKTYTCTHDPTHVKTVEIAATSLASGPIAQTISVAAKAKTIKATKLKKKAVTLKGALKVTGAKTSVTYKLVKVSKKKYAKKFSITKKGAIKVKKGVPKGTYKLSVRVSAKANAAYKSAFKNVVVKVKVK